MPLQYLRGHILPSPHHEGFHHGSYIRTLLPEHSFPSKTIKAINNSSANHVAWVEQLRQGAHIAPLQNLTKCSLLVKVNR